jgi:hypothetical protein
MGEVMDAVEVGDVMEAAQTTDSVEATAEVADTVETAVGVADAVEAAMEGVTAAVTPARRRDGRRESCHDDCGCESSRKRRFSKHGFISSAGRPPSAMLPPSADATLNVASRMREPVAISALEASCRRRCQVRVSKIVKSN